jgi:hypothetical protein
MGTPAASPNLDRLLRLHAITRDLSAASNKQLRAYLETLSPLFRPRRLLGDYMEGAGREPVVGSERTWAELQDLYRKFAVKVFDLRPELPNPLPSLASQFALHEWEYAHGVQTERGWQTIRVTSPLTWILTYVTPAAPGVLRQQVAEGNPQKDSEPAKGFVLQACILSMMFQKFPALRDLLAGLRYHVEVRNVREFGELPLVTVSAPFATLRPADDLIAKAAGFAGGATFAEVVDIETIRQLNDPLRDEAVRLLQQRGEEIA